MNRETARTLTAQGIKVEDSIGNALVVLNGVEPKQYPEIRNLRNSLKDALWHVRNALRECEEFQNQKIRG